MFSRFSKITWVAQIDFPDSIFSHIFSHNLPSKPANLASPRSLPSVAGSSLSNAAVSLAPHDWQLFSRPSKWRRLSNCTWGALLRQEKFGGVHDWGTPKWLVYKGNGQETCWFHGVKTRTQLYLAMVFTTYLWWFGGWFTIVLPHDSSLWTSYLRWSTP